MISRVGVDSTKKVGRVGGDVERVGPEESHRKGEVSLGVTWRGPSHRDERVRSWDCKTLQGGREY